MKLIYFVESYVAGGSDKIANILLDNLNIKNIQLLLNKRADKKIILNTNKKITVKLYSLITPAEIHEKVNKFKGNNLVYFILKITSVFFIYPLIFYSIIYFYFILRSSKASHFFSHNGGHPGGIYNGTSLMAASLIPSIKYKFYAFHSNPIKYRNYLFLFDFFWDKIIEKTSKIITISKAAAKNFTELRFFKKEPIVIHNGLKKNKLKNYNDSSKLKILHIGYFDYNKNQVLLLKSLENLVARNIKNIHLTFVGNIVDKNVKYKFDDFLKENDLKNYVTVTGFIEDTTPYYYDSDLLICTSFVEGFPLSILEAMSIGLPIISTNVGGVNEQIDDGINGFLIEINNPLDLSNKIQYFIENKESIIQMGKESYKKFNSKFELKKMIDSYNSLFKF
jgi:glycosyltransferase involved in cell wall biosynthesis